MTDLEQADAAQADAPPDPREPVDRLLRDLRTRRDGLAQREAERRILVFGPNELTRTAPPHRLRQLVSQLTHPLALLLWAAALLAAATGTPALAVAIVIVVVLNAVFAFAQEQEAERAVEALQEYLPPQAIVRRDGHRRQVTARDLVPGDVLLLSEGDRVSADARLLNGTLELDISALTGEALPVSRSAAEAESDVTYLSAPDLVFSGTVCTAGEAEAVVFATGMHTELGRIAALSEGARAAESPLEREVRRVAWLIAIIAFGVGVAFLPIGMFGARLSFEDAAVFAVGLLVANVPEGLLPTITLALAAGVRSLARRGAIVKRLSAVETLGSTTVICTDKTGTLTQNRMRATAVWTLDSEIDLPMPGSTPPLPQVRESAALHRLALAVSLCSSAELDPLNPSIGTGDATEVALLLAAVDLGVQVNANARDQHRRTVFHFDPARRLMSTIDAGADSASTHLTVHTKGAPEEVLSRCTAVKTADGERPMTAGDRVSVSQVLDRYAAAGLRVLAGADRALDTSDPPTTRDEVERELCFLGLVAMFDPPRPEVPDAVEACHSAGIRVVVVTGDHSRTASEIAQRVGIEATATVTGTDLDSMTDAELDVLLERERELVFARSSPEAKLRIADSLRDLGEVVAMTGDGVNDAPALRQSDIGVAMGRSGTDVAREAATVILTDDNFATIVAAVEEGRRVYANIRKFIFYIFVHFTPEVAPFLLFALSGGRIPLPLTVMAILAIDLGTETLPALALGREPAEPGIMRRRPRPRNERIISWQLLVRAWLFLGPICAALSLGAFYFVMHRAGWRVGDATGVGAPLHHTYLQASTMTFLAIVVCQIGTAFAARTDRASLRSIGTRSNPLLLLGIAFELAVATAVVVLPPLQSVFGTAIPPPEALALLVPMPLIVWGADELVRFARRRLEAQVQAAAR